MFIKTLDSWDRNPHDARPEKRWQAEMVGPWYDDSNPFAYGATKEEAIAGVMAQVKDWYEQVGEYLKEQAMASPAMSQPDYWTLTCDCEAGHVQTLRISKEMSREWVEQLAGLLDGTSPLYVFPPGSDSPIGKCCYTLGVKESEYSTCGKPFKAVVS